MATISGRMINFFSKHVPAMGRAGTKRQVKQYRESNGTKGGVLLGKPCFLLDVTGRTSGESRPVMLMLCPRGDALIVTASYGGHPEAPNWYKNLMAAGEADVQVGADTWTVTPRELPEGAERDECWDMLVSAYPDFASYQELTDRRLPVIVLERETS